MPVHEVIDMARSRNDQGKGTHRTVHVPVDGELFEALKRFQAEREAAAGFGVTIPLTEIARIVLRRGLDELLGAAVAPKRAKNW